MPSATISWVPTEDGLRNEILRASAAATKKLILGAGFVDPACPIDRVDIAFEPAANADPIVQVSAAEAEPVQ